MRPLDHRIHDYVLQLAVTGGVVDVYAALRQFTEDGTQAHPDCVLEKIHEAIVTFNANAVWMPGESLTPALQASLRRVQSADEPHERSYTFPSTVSWYIH